MKTIVFDTGEEFDNWVANGNELYAIYEFDGTYICDVEEPIFIHLLDAELINPDTRQFVCKLDVSRSDLCELIGTHIIIKEYNESN